MTSLNGIFLPSEILVQIFSNFSHKELCQVVAPVCKTWWTLSKCSPLWKELCLPVTRRGSKDAYCNLLLRCNFLQSLEVYFEIQFDSLIACSMQLSNLRKLSLSCVETTATIIGTIVSNLPQIEMLGLESNTIPDLKDAIGHIATLDNLTALNIYCSNLDDTCITMIAKKCLKLERLHIQFDSLITDQAVKELSTFRCDTLRDLRLNCKNLTDDSMVYLSSCRNLTAFEVDCGFLFTDKALTAFNNLRCLTKLKLYDCSHVSANGWSNFFSNAALRNLRRLELVDLKVDDVGLENLARTNNKNLQHLFISTCSTISDYGVKVVIDNCSSLRSLELLGISKLTGKCLVNISSKLPNLVFLLLAKCKKVIPAVLNELTNEMQQMPWAHLLHY